MLLIMMKKLMLHMKNIGNALEIRFRIAKRVLVVCHRQFFEMYFLFPISGVTISSSICFLYMYIMYILYVNTYIGILYMHSVLYTLLEARDIF